MLAVKGRLELLTGRPAAAQRTLQEAADLLADADPRLAVELLTESVYWTVEAGLFDVASRVTGRITDLGSVVVIGSPADFGRLIVEETEKWGKVVKFSGAKPD